MAKWGYNHKLHFQYGEFIKNTEDKIHRKVTQHQKAILKTALGKKYGYIIENI